MTLLIGTFLWLLKHSGIESGKTRNTGKPFLNGIRHNVDPSLAENLYRYKNLDSPLSKLKYLYGTEFGCKGKEKSFRCHSIVGGFCCRIYAVSCVIKYDN